MMAKTRCFPAFSAIFSRKKSKLESSKAVKKATGNVALRVNPEELVEQSVHNAAAKKSSSEKDPQAAEAAYEGSDEHDESFSEERDFSEFDLQASAVEKDETDQELNIGDPENRLTPQASIQTQHASDPGNGRASMFRQSPPVLKRSCSNIGARRAATLVWYNSNSNSSDDLPCMWEALDGEAACEVPGSPSSVLSSFSADRAKGRKRSSCLVLPSRSTELWCNRVVSSHRNHCNTPWILMSQEMEFSIDAAYRNNSAISGSERLESSPCFETMKNKTAAMEQSEIGIKDMLVNLSADYSRMDRVHAWVDSLGDDQFCSSDISDGAAVLATYEVGETSRKRKTRSGRPTTNEIVQAKSNILQSALSFPPFVRSACRLSNAFGNLRTLNLSGSSIGDISLRFLPKNLHMLDLSKNKITTTEGLRDLTRLRVLNLSFNKISRIGQGVSNCVLIRELYLAGNKIGNVEGLHRLLKLTVLDLSFNKITTLRAMGQLVAHYKSLMVLHLHGNPIGINMGDETLEKSICSFLPGLLYLNKRPVRPHQRGRKAAAEATAKVALGASDWTSHRRVAAATRRPSQAEETGRRRAARRPSKYGRAGLPSRK